MSAFSYTKLFSGITESTIWCEPAGTRLVWITLLAKCDLFGRFSGSLPGLARLANVTLEETAKAIETFLAPDPYSRTPDYEGRRIEAIDGGWRLLNHEKYREMRDEEKRRIQNQQAQQRSRDRKAAVSNSADGQPPVSLSPGKSAQATTTTATSKSNNKEPMPSRGSRLPKDWVLPDDWRAWAVAERPGLDVDLEAAKFADFWHAKAGKDATKLNWEATWRNWIRNASAGRGGFAPIQRPLSAMERVEANIAKGVQQEQGAQLTLEGQHVRIAR